MEKICEKYKVSLNINTRKLSCKMKGMGQFEIKGKKPIRRLGENGAIVTMVRTNVWGLTWT